MRYIIFLLLLIGCSQTNNVLKLPKTVINNTIFTTDTTIILRGSFEGNGVEVFINYVKGFNIEDEHISAVLNHLSGKKSLTFFPNGVIDETKITLRRESSCDNPSEKYIVIQKDSLSNLLFSLHSNQKKDNFDLDVESGDVKTILWPLNVNGKNIRERDSLRFENQIFHSMTINMSLDTLSVSETSRLLGFYSKFDTTFSKFIDKIKPQELKKYNVNEWYFEKIRNCKNLYQYYLPVDLHNEFKASYPIAFSDRFVAFELLTSDGNHNLYDARRVTFDNKRQKFLSIENTLEQGKVGIFKSILKDYAQKQLCDDDFKNITKSVNFENLERFDFLFSDKYICALFYDIEKNTDFNFIKITIPIHSLRYILTPQYFEN